MSLTDPQGLSPFDAFSHDPASDFIKTIFPNAEKLLFPYTPTLCQRQMIRVSKSTYKITILQA